jgi:hypothetical protein
MITRTGHRNEDEISLAQNKVRWMVTVSVAIVYDYCVLGNETVISIKLE